jgi:probable HAF family extracellular repeat protein
MKTSHWNNGIICGVVVALTAASSTLAAPGTIVRVPTLGGSQVDVRALNNRGALAGFSRTANEEQHAFVFLDGVMRDLGTLGGSVSLATGLNDMGDAICDSDTPDWWQHASVYRGGRLVDLGVLPGGSFSTAISLNDAGDVAGQGDTADFSIRGFLFRNDQLTDIGSLGGGYSFVTDMNASGHIVGESWTDMFESRAFVFRDGTMTDLETLGGSSSKAWGINDKGVIVGESTDVTGNTRAFRFSSGSMEDLGTLGGSAAAAYAINNAGDILGDSLIADDLDYHAFLFVGGRMLDLGTLGGTYSASAAMNNLGHVIGDAEDATGMIVPFLWKDGTMVDLNSLLPENSGWVLYTAYHINDLGHIVGYGTLNGEFAWYMLDVGSQNRAPVANAGGDQTVECGLMTLLDGSASSDPDGDPLTFEWREGTMVLGYGATLSVNLGLGTHTLTLTVRDSHDATADASVTVVVRDTTAPTVACHNTHTVAAGLDCQAAVPDFASAAVVLDNCTSSAALRKWQSPVTGSLLGLGTHQVVVSVEDASGNVGTCTVLLTVADVTAPTGDCPPAMTVFVGADCQGVVPDFTAAMLVSDNCTPAAQLVKAQSPLAGTMMGLGSHNVTLTVTDAAGNRSMCVTTLLVVDNTAPTITCPAAMTVDAQSVAGTALQDLTVLASASDNCGGNLAITQSPTAGTLLGLGTHTVTLTVTDAAGNRNSGTTTVTVVDRTAPVISAVSVNPSILRDNGKLVPIAVTVSATDNTDSAPVSRILSITSSEPVTGRGDRSSPDWVVGSGLTGQVRAERTDNRVGRVYTVTVVCTDASGNSATATASVHVPGKNNALALRNKARRGDD